MKEIEAAGEDDVLIQVAEVYDLALSVLTAAGLSQTQARPVARVIADCERDECRSHGLLRLPGCVSTAQHPKFVRDAEPVLEDVTPAVVRVDARNGYSLAAFEQGLPVLEQKAKALGVAVLAINNCFHFSALWPEIEAICTRNLVGLAMTPSHSWVAPAGATRPIFGTNPLAFGWPRTGRQPYVFDFATSVMARSDIAMAKLKGTSIPGGCGVDIDGNPSTDPARVLEGAMWSFGGHKGAAIATMIELLAGPLIGDLTSSDSMAYDGDERAAPFHGELVIALDPKLLGNGQDELNQARAEQLFAGFADQSARLPSERRYAARARSDTQGVHVPKSLYNRILAIAETGVDSRDKL